jgi:hypothetical protein
MQTSKRRPTHCDETQPMNTQERKRLEELRLSQEVIAKTEEVLRVWEIEESFLTCSQVPVGSCGRGGQLLIPRNSIFGSGSPRL